MTKIEQLNRRMLALEKAGALTEAEYATYKGLLEAVELLVLATSFIETPGDLTQDEADQLKVDLGAYCAQLEKES